MSRIKDILSITSHRPVPMPGGTWKYYQEWHDVFFAHWKVPVISLKGLVPAGLEPDLFGGDAWISLTAFTVKKLHPHHLPPFPPLSDFHEINIRTYVLRNKKPGIYFLSLEAQKTGSALLGRVAIGLNYYKSVIYHRNGHFESENQNQDFHLNISYKPLDVLKEKNQLDKWLTERYSLFHEYYGGIYGHDIHHKEWILKNVEVETFYVKYRFRELEISGPADLYHYSDGVQVPTWKKVKE